jgi:hypothetical protein
MKTIFATLFAGLVLNFAASALECGSPLALFSLFPPQAEFKKSVSSAGICFPSFVQPKLPLAAADYLFP